MAHLEIKIKFSNDLSPGRAVNGYCVDREICSLKEPFSSWFGRHHGG